MAWNSRNTDDLAAKGILVTNSATKFGVFFLRLLFLSDKSPQSEMCDFDLRRPSTRSLAALRDAQNMSMTSLLPLARQLLLGVNQP